MNVALLSAGIFGTLSLAITATIVSYENKKSKTLDALRAKQAQEHKQKASTIQTEKLRAMYKRKGAI
ncbi:hypothetical protein VIN01S_10090 [Vibrio inusitatus NBRC 102082]|uniref:Uncharacterized protein n=1 Tax=Vibrio inusitatus NBRC 102082 TaxID=1219070 RepID=A0A4Y3HT64_9VIBR|nr:hypothetical protein [Vibrio inusitatus]GEA50205.1 hypothetical protein VIN01S_10090 [Vibrio inusitatus NBRC 102082]